MYLLFLHSTDDSDQEIFAFVESRLDIISKVTLGHSDVIFGHTVLGHEVEETIVNVDLNGVVSRTQSMLIWHTTHELVFVTADVGNVHVMGRWTDIFLSGG